MIIGNIDEIFKHSSPDKNITLHKNISIPSEIHVYSLAIEYMRMWFLKKFDDDYFKTVYINGKHVMDDFRHFNRQELIRREKPALAIMPTVNYDYNRDTLDLRLGGRDILTRNDGLSETIIGDNEKNIFLGMKLRQMEINFDFKVRVGSRAEQIDLYNFMKYAFRVGSTQSEYMSYDFHIPSQIILNIAKHAGFVIEKSKDGKKRDVIKNIPGFLRYLNSHSHAPILYKMRTINGNAEYFIRMDNMYTHISNLDSLSLDDGEREGQIDNNFHIEMQCILKIPAPQYYFYYSNDEIETTFNNRKEFAGLYEIKHVEPPTRNNKGWEQYIATQWNDETRHIDSIEFKELFENSELNSVIDHNRNMGISPGVFIDIKLFNNAEDIPIKVNWETYEIIVDNDMESDISLISIYVDLEYVNGQLILLNSLEEDNNRMKEDHSVR